MTVFLTDVSLTRYSTPQTTKPSANSACRTSNDQVFSVASSLSSSTSPLFPFARFLLPQTTAAYLYPVFASRGAERGCFLLRLLATAELLVAVAVAADLLVPIPPPVPPLLVFWPSAMPHVTYVTSRRLVNHILRTPSTASLITSCLFLMPRRGALSTLIYYRYVVSRRVSTLIICFRYFLSSFVVALRLVPRMNSETASWKDRFDNSNKWLGFLSSSSFFTDILLVPAYPTLIFPRDFACHTIAVASSVNMALQMLRASLDRNCGLVVEWKEPPLLALTPY